MVWQSTIQEKALVQLSTQRYKWWYLTCQDFGVSLTIIVSTKSAHGWEIASPWAHTKHRDPLFVLAGEELTEGAPYLLLKAGLTTNSNQAFSQPGFETPKDSTLSGASQSSRKLVPEFDCPQSEKCFGFFLSSQSVKNQSVSTSNLGRCVVFPKPAWGSR